MPIKNAYFYCPANTGTANNAFYPHNAIALAEGLRLLGISVFSNNNFWILDEQNKKYLFTHDPQVSPTDCDMIVLSAEYLLRGETFPQAATRPCANTFLVFIDLADGVYSPSFHKEIQHFDIILRASYNSKAKGYPSNMKPWCFGTPQRIIDVCLPLLFTWEKRTPAILCNYRLPHPVRLLLQTSSLFTDIVSRFTLDTRTETFETPKEPTALLDWKRTGRRHYPHYYRRLCATQAVACFGGYFYSKKLFTINTRYFDITQKKPFANSIKQFLCALHNKCTPKSQKTIYQWDSFRLWESFAAESLVFHLHFEKYGLALPVMPQNRVHYIGIDLDTIKDDIHFLLHASEDALSQIAKNGRRWMLEHYSPVPMARRLLALLSR